MSKIKKYNLDYKVSHSYMKEVIDSVNTLSRYSLEMIDFMGGSFFTFFPDTLEFKNHILSFKDGYRDSSILVTDCINKFVYEMISSSHNLVAVFDDFLSKYHPKYKEALFLSNGKFLNDEVYYFFSKGNISKKTIQTAFEYSDQIWHSLTIISSARLLSQSKKITVLDCENICKNAEIVIVTAYDGQGCIFWEKHTQNLNK